MLLIPHTKERVDFPMGDVGKRPNCIHSNNIRALHPAGMQAVQEATIMENIIAYGVPLATVVIGCWLLAAIGVACDIYMARRWRSLWWVPLTMVFGPFAAAIFVATWQRR